MRVRILHELGYAYGVPPSSVVQVLRLTPRGHDGQYVSSWQIRVDCERPCRLSHVDDAFANATHTFTLEGPVEAYTIVAEGEVDTQDMNGLVHGAVERFPTALYLRETPLTQASPALAAFAREVAAEAGPEPLNQLHALMKAVHATVLHEAAKPDLQRSAQEAFELRRGNAHDLTHIFLAAARQLGHPARFVTGYHAGAGEVVTAVHGWAEAHVPELGWIGFDPRLSVCPTEEHVRLAVALDYLGAAPVRGSRYGGDGEAVLPRISAMPA